MPLQDPPEYHDPPGGLMVFDFKIQHLLADAAPKEYNGQLEDFAGHFTLVNHELVQVGVLKADRACQAQVISFARELHEMPAVGT